MGVPNHGCWQGDWALESHLQNLALIKLSFAGGVLVREKGTEPGVMLAFLLHPAFEDTDGCSGHIRQLRLPRTTLDWDTWLDSVSEGEAVFAECFGISVFMLLHEPSAHRALLSNQVHQSVVETRGEERPSDSDSAQTKLSLVSEGRGEQPRVLRSDLSPAICRAVQRGWGFMAR